MKFICDIKRDAAMNMALDEVLFEQCRNEPVLRLYFWDGKHTTIGYFQKTAETENKNFVRRFTGGLTVNHENDISYGFIASSDNWQDVYSQSETFKKLHTAIQKALLSAGIKSLHLDQTKGAANNICTETLYENDLLYNGKKIAGSCIRRRGNRIFVQGSVHIALEDEAKAVFCQDFAANVAKLLNDTVSKEHISRSLEAAACELAAVKYRSPDWNNKF